MQDSESAERERLERFLRWQQAAGKNRGAVPRRSRSFVVGSVAVGAATVALLVPLMGRPLDTPRHFASERNGKPAENVAASSGGFTSAVPPRSPDVGRSSRIKSSDSGGGAEVVAIERAPAKERPRAEPSRPARTESRALRRSRRPSQHPGRCKGYPACSQRSPTRINPRTQLPQLRHPHRRRRQILTPRRAFGVR